MFKNAFNLKTLLNAKIKKGNPMFKEYDGNIAYLGLIFSFFVISFGIVKFVKNKDKIDIKRFLKRLKFFSEALGDGLLIGWSLMLLVSSVFLIVKSLALKSIGLGIVSIINALCCIALLVYFSVGGSVFDSEKEQK